MAEGEQIGGSKHSEESVKLFVGQVPKHITEADLLDMFQEFAVVDEVNIIKDKVTKASRGCCFVICPSREEADKAVDACHNKKTLQGASSPLQVKYADGELERLEHRLFVGMLPKNVSEAELSALFSQFGTIKELQILRGSQQTSKGCAFLKYETKDQALAALEAVNGEYKLEDSNVPLVVKWADKERERPARKAQKSQTRASKLPADPSLNPSEIRVVPMSYLPPYNGYGFQFPTVNQGNALHGVRLDIVPEAAQRGYGLPPTGYLGSVYTAEQNPMTYPGGMIAQRPSPGSPGSLPSMLFVIPSTASPDVSASSKSHVEGPPGANLFIYHIPQEFGDQDLANSFQQFGKVLSAKVFVDKATGMSKCFGFVSYDSPVSAHSAINEMNGFQLGSKKLKVQLKRDNKQSYVGSGYPTVQYPVTYPGGMIAQRPSPGSPGSLPSILPNSPSTASPDVNASPKSHVEGPPGANLFIYHIPQEFGDQDLANSFQQFGRVLSAKVFVDKATGMSKCFGFVSYDSPVSAHSAINVMNGFQLGSKKLKVQLKRDNKQNTPYGVTYEQIRSVTKQEARGGNWLELPLSIKTAGGSTSTSPSIQRRWPTWRFVNPETEIKEMKSVGYEYLEREQTEDESLLSIVLNSEFQSFSTGILFLYGENYEFEKDKLIQLWIAGGFIENEPMEINGANYFEILMSEGYILRSHSDSMYKVNYSMVNSRFDMFSDKSSYLRLESESQNNAATAEILHVSVVDDMIDTMFKTPDKFDKLRTLLFMGTCSSRLDKVLLELFLSFESLVVLDLSGTDIKELPSSTRKMINLRYLDLSWTFIELLPKAICRFEGLQTLRLKGCSCLWRLPSEMERLTKLRHLDFDILGQLAIMPKRIGSLVNLRTLSAFLIGTEEGCKITELRDLNYLAGEFCIARLEHVQSAVDARLASLSAKKHLKKLELRWSDSSLQEKEDEGISNSVLENLRPHSDLEELHIQFYPGTNLPSWIADEAFQKLARVTLFKCEHVFLLFPSMQKLPSLEYLRLISLISVIKLDFGGQMDQCAAFPKLKVLIIDKMLNLETWIESKDGDFPCLAELTIKYCSKLCELPSLVYLSSMKHLEISSCPKVQFVPEKELSLLLEHLMVEDCPLIQESYSKQEGQFLEKIKHVPSVWIDQDDDSELLDDDEHTNGSSDDTEELS